MWNFQEVFLIVLSLFANLKLMSALFILETVLVYKLKTFTNCKEVKHILIMFIAIIYIFYVMRYLINSWKLLSENPQLPSLKKCTLHFTPLFGNIVHFSGPSCRKGPSFLGVEDTLLSLVRMVSFFPILVELNKTVCIPASKRKILIWIILKVRV